MTRNVVTRDGTASSPLVSIGMPAYNSARYIQQSLESLLLQDYPNLEIEVSDDGSTDETASICDRVASVDARVRVSRQAHLGERRNFNAVLEHARGPFFMWAADHDLWDPSYVSSGVEALTENPHAVLAHGRTMQIDEDGRELGVMDQELDISQDRPVDRYAALIWQLNWGNPIYGLMRLGVVARTGGYGDTPSPDHLVLAKLALAGPFVQLPGAMYYRRRNRPSEAPDEMRRRQMRDLEPRQADRWANAQRADFYRTLRDAHLRAIMMAPLSNRDRLSATLATMACFASRFDVESRPYRAVRTGARLLPGSLRRRITRRA